MRATEEWCEHCAALGQWWEGPLGQRTHVFCLYCNGTGAVVVHKQPAPMGEAMSEPTEAYPANDYPPAVVDIVAVAGRTGWDGVTEAVMTYHGTAVERKARNFLARLNALGYVIAPTWVAPLAPTGEHRYNPTFPGGICNDCGEYHDRLPHTGGLAPGDLEVPND